MRFVTPILHCNIDKNGAVSLDVLQDRWSPALTILKVVMCLSCLLQYVSICSPGLFLTKLNRSPNPDDPLTPDVAYLCKTDYLKYLETVRASVKKHAMAKLIGM